MIRASLDKRPREVAAMFDDVAREVRPHQRRPVAGPGPALAPAGARGRRPRARARPVLDLAAGTGTSSEPFADAGVDVVPADFSLGHAAGRQAGAAPTWPSPPATRTRLPFADDSFDAVTISFGLRNVADPTLALREMLRVTRPGGRLVVCEFSQPVNAAFRKVYTEYLMRVAAPDRPPGQLQPRVLRLPRRVDPGVARPAGARRGGRAAPAGATSQWRNLSGGIVALHRAVKAG